MGKKKKFYVVWKGKKPGIYETWKECKKSIDGHAGAEYKSFESFEVAKKAYIGTYADFKGKKKTAPTLSKAELERIGLPNYHSISVDAASSGNPGIMEYQGVDTKTGKKSDFDMSTRRASHFVMPSSMNNDDSATRRVTASASGCTRSRPTSCAAR